MLESRMNSLNITEGVNTQEIVIDKLIELWNEKPENSKKLFAHIAELVADFDNPPLKQYTSNGIIHLYIMKDGKKKNIKQSRYQSTIDIERNEYIKQHY